MGQREFFAAVITAIISIIVSVVTSYLLINPKVEEVYETKRAKEVYAIVQDIELNLAQLEDFRTYQKATSSKGDITIEELVDKNKRAIEKLLVISRKEILRNRVKTFRDQTTEAINESKAAYFSTITDAEFYGASLAIAKLRLKVASCHFCKIRKELDSRYNVNCDGDLGKLIRDFKFQEKSKEAKAEFDRLYDYSFNGGLPLNCKILNR